MSLEGLVDRARREFDEMPGLRLTAEQARRLWDLDERRCAAVLGRLVAARFLVKTRDGRFVRGDAATAWRRLEPVSEFIFRL